MDSLFVHDDAASDLAELYKTNQSAAATITTLLQELKGDPDLLDRLTQHNYGTHNLARFHVSKWLEHWNQGRDLWRLKDWELEQQGDQYRIIYAYMPPTRDHYVLAVAHRDFRYDANHPITKRILGAYDDL